MKNQYIDVMRKLSDEKLLEILNVRRDSYVPEAIEAVEQVLKERDVNYTKVSDEDLENNLPTLERTAASQGKRLFGHIIDYIIITLVYYIITQSIGEQHSLLFCLIYFFYFAILELASNRGRTIGKTILEMSVVDENCNKPSNSQIFIRSLCRFIPFDALSIVFGRLWHDKISKTYVIDDNKHH